jgi:phosphatidylserine decarboxylase
MADMKDNMEIQDNTDTKNNTYEREKISLNSGNKAFPEFLYKTLVGRILLKLLTARWLSCVVGLFLDTGASRVLIKRFIRKNNIDMSQYKDEHYSSFNAFFTRRIKDGERPVSPSGLISPCDSYLTAYDIDDELRVTIKGRTYSMQELLKNEYLSKKFAHGKCLVFRLTVSDYHRYCYIDGGYVRTTNSIRGILHTVQPIACGERDVYKENSRAYCHIETDNFGDVVQMEVGAMMVGRICQNSHLPRIERGDEKGRFEFGGSTIVVLLESGAASVDEEITKNTANGYETRVKYGEKIGESLKNSAEERAV